MLFSDKYIGLPLQSELGLFLLVFNDLSYVLPGNGVVDGQLSGMRSVAALLRLWQGDEGRTITPNRSHNTYTPTRNKLADHA